MGKVLSSFTNGWVGSIARAKDDVVVALANKSGAAIAFGVPMLLAFLMSTLYHALPQDLPKRVFGVLDHDFVFLYIAGAFTPYCVLTLADSPIAQAVLAIVWAAAFAGILIESIWFSRPKWLPLVIGVAMCCAVFALAPQLMVALAPAGLGLLVAALICFAVGFAFYLFRKVPYLWFVSHLVVLAGSVCLFLSIVLFVI